MTDRNCDDLNDPAASGDDRDPINVESPGLVPVDNVSMAASGAHGERRARDGRAAPHRTGRLVVMPPERYDSWQSSAAAEDHAGGAPHARRFRTRRLAVLTVVLALATAAGAIGGAVVATSGLGQPSADVAKAQVQAADNHARLLQASIHKMETEIAALKSAAGHASKLAAAQYSKVSDRAEKAEKAQAETAAKLAKVTEALEKVRVASAAPAHPAAANRRDVTGSIPAADAAKSRVGRLPTVRGWSLRDVADGSALVQGPRGLFRVYTGDPLPGLGRVETIRRQDGRWVVVTARGLIVAR